MPHLHVRPVSRTSSSVGRQDLPDRHRLPIRWLAPSLVAGVVLVAACSAANPSWTYDPSVGVATPAAASGGSSEAAVASASSAPSAEASPAASAGSSAAAGGATISLTAQNVAFDTKELSAPAGQPFTVAFDNKDAGIPHNFAIYTDKSASNNLFRGDTVNGPGTATYSVPALPPGTYYFQCDIHPTIMNGTFTVK